MQIEILKKFLHLDLCLHLVLHKLLVNINVKKGVGLNVQEASRFTFPVSTETYDTNNQFEYNEKCLVYFHTYKKYVKQYVEQTSDTFRHHGNSY